MEFTLHYNQYKFGCEVSLQIDYEQGAFKYLTLVYSMTLNRNSSYDKIESHHIVDSTRLTIMIRI